MFEKTKREKELLARVPRQGEINSCAGWSDESIEKRLIYCGYIAGNKDYPYLTDRGIKAQSWPLLRFWLEGILAPR